MTSEAASMRRYTALPRAPWAWAAIEKSTPKASVAFASVTSQRCSIDMPQISAKLAAMTERFAGEFRRDTRPGGVRYGASVSRSSR